MAAFAGVCVLCACNSYICSDSPSPFFSSEAAAGGKPREPAGADDGHVRNLASLADKLSSRSLRPSGLRNIRSFDLSRSLECPVGKGRECRVTLHRHHGHRHPYPSLPRPPPLTRKSLSTIFHLLSRGRDWNPELATNGGSIIKIGGSERGAFHLKEHVTFFAHCLSPDLERSIEVMRAFLYSKAKRNELVSSDMRELF